MAKVGNVNIRKQGICVGVCCAALIIIFRKRLFYGGEGGVIKESLFQPSFPTPRNLSILAAWRAVGTAVQSRGLLGGRTGRHGGRVPLTFPNVTSHVEDARHPISHHVFPPRALGFVAEAKCGFMESALPLEAGELNVDAS